jgi:hypothetical protein
MTKLNFDAARPHCVSIISIAAVGTRPVTFEQRVRLRLDIPSSVGVPANQLHVFVDVTAYCEQYRSLAIEGL